MNDLNQSRGILRKGIVVVVFFVGLAFTAVLTLTLTQQTQAGFDCSGNNWSVGNEADLNAAVACYNSQTTSNEYTIIFTQNISLTTSTISINNQLSSINGITLTVDGGGFIIDGQNIVDVRPFHIGLKNRVNIDNITITGGYSRGGGGGIFNGGTLTLNNTRVYSNTASTAGGIDNNGTLTLKNSSVSYNSADTIAGISSGNILNLYYSTISHNSARGTGGISNRGNLNIYNSTISYNSSLQHGGGIFNVINENETFVLSNSTISNNSANINGGGIVNYGDGTLDFQNNTITYNSGNVGGGIYSYSAGVFSVKNNIIAHNVGGDCFNDFGTITDVGYNIMGDGSCDFTDGSDPMLGPLQDNGGATFTHALLPGSPAIDAGDTNLTIDQRGVTRPQGSADDIGAYEVVHYNTLTIFKNGTGSVTSIPYGIDCGSTCDNDFVSGIVVTLTASSNSNAIFTGWEGAGCIGIGDCVLTMESNKVVTATFQSYYPVYLPITIKD